MKKLTDEQWRDVAPRIVNHPCPFCRKQYLSSEPRYSVVGDINILSVVCDECGHTILFDVDVLRQMAQKIDEDFHNNGWR